MGQDDEVGKGETPDMTTGDMTTGDVTTGAFDRLQARDARNERRVLWAEIGIAALLALLVAGYLIVA
jgi:hypothetical protein